MATGRSRHCKKRALLPPGRPIEAPVRVGLLRLTMAFMVAPLVSKLPPAFYRAQAD
jgi:hypothetical protein